MQDAVRGFYDYLSSIERYSEHTRQSYQNDIDSFVSFLSIVYQVSDPSAISHFQIRSWMVHLFELKCSARSINRKISALSTFFKYMRKFGRVNHDPMSKIMRPKMGKRLPVFIPESQVTNALLVTQNPNDDENYVSSLSHLVILMLYSTGIRRSELIGIRDTDIDLSRRTLLIMGKGRKERLIPLADELISQIKIYQVIRDTNIKNKENNSLFLTTGGKPLYPKMVYNIVRSVLNMIPDLERKSPHILRHTFATHLSGAGGDINAIKMLLGHANLASTQVYMHNAPERLKAVYEKAHPKGS